MNRKGFKIRYDRNSGVLSIEIKRGRSVDSDISGNVVIDYDRKGEIVRINLYQFSFDAFRKARKAMRNFGRKFEMPLIAK